MAGRKSKISSRMLKNLNAQRAELLQLSSEIDTAMRSPKDVKVKSVPWYVDDGSGARGRAQKILEDELQHRIQVSSHYRIFELREIRKAISHVT